MKIHVFKIWKYFKYLIVYPSSSIKCWECLLVLQYFWVYFPLEQIVNWRYWGIGFLSIQCDQLILRSSIYPLSYEIWKKASNKSYRYTQVSHFRISILYKVPNISKEQCCYILNIKRKRKMCVILTSFTEWFAIFNDFMLFRKYFEKN